MPVRLRRAISFRDMHTSRFLLGRRGAQLSQEERGQLEAAISEVRLIEARQMMVQAGEPLTNSTLLLTGFMARYMDDRAGHRQMVALHLPGDFVDLHAYPLQYLDHDVATLTPCEVAHVPHERLTAITQVAPHLGRMLWFSTLLDAAMHREWIFRLGRLDATGRMAHFLLECWVRMRAAGIADGPEFRLPLTQADFAETLGLTNVHVSRTLSAMRRAKLADVRDGVVRLINLPELARIGEFSADYLYLNDGKVTP